jgi:hypothetical protein
MRDRFFLDALEAQKRSYKYPVQNITVVTDANLQNRLLERTDKFLTDILNTKLGSDEIYYFHTVYSRIKSANVLETSKTFEVTSDHIVYRDTKIYGVSISLKTVHSLATTDIMMTEYSINGYVFEDKITDYQPQNLVDNNYQDFRKDDLIVRDEKYEKEYLCKY